MAINLKSLQTRTLSALVLIPVVLAAVWFGGWPFYALIAVLACICVHEWLGMARKTERVVWHSVWGMVYIGIGFAACLFVRVIGWERALILLVIVWSTDIGAYFCGSVIGGKKLAPQISPNKTWAGFLGGGLIAVILGGILCVLLLLPYTPYTIPYSIALLLAPFIVFVSIMGQLGDLLESWMKRAAGVKDTGTIIPGHGGLLDRVDSLLLAAPAMCVSFFVFTRFFINI